MGGWADRWVGRQAALYIYIYIYNIERERERERERYNMRELTEPGSASA